MVKSVTGGELGTNDLLQVRELKPGQHQGYSATSFEMKVPEPNTEESKSSIGNVTLPVPMESAPPPPKMGEGSVFDMWFKH